MSKKEYVLTKFFGRVAMLISHSLQNIMDAHISLLKKLNGDIVQ
jgi:hypothetical protein